MEQRVEDLRDVAIAAALFEERRLHFADLRDHMLSLLRNFLPTHEKRRALAFGDVMVKRYANVQARCTCHCEPADVCASVAAGEPVRFEKVELDDRLWVTPRAAVEEP